MATGAPDALGIPAPPGAPRGNESECFSEWTLAGSTTPSLPMSGS